MIKPLPNPKCFPELLARINRARRSIAAVNYIAEFSTRDDSNIVRASSALRRSESRTDPVLILADALVHARKRGVKVSVILEGSRLKDNYPFYRFLKDKDVDVWLDTSQTLIHHKALLVDDRILITGSHNWSHAAFFKNEEFSVMTNDETTVRSFRQELKKITRQRNEIRSHASKGSISLSANFISQVANPLFRVHAEHAFNLYMILCYEDKGAPRPLRIDAKRWGEMLGFNPEKAGKTVSENYKRYYFAQRLNRVLGQLKRVSLIQVDRKTDTVTRLCLTPDVRHNFIEVPLEFWDLGWLTRRSFPAKAFYFICLAEKIDSPFYPWWSRSMNELKRRYGIAHTIDSGVHELEDYNILEVLRGIPIKRGKFYSEEAHYYRINPLYDMKQFNLRLLKLTRKFSKELIRQSQNAAKAFWATHNIDALKTIASLIQRNGWTKVRKAAMTISRLPTSSSRRCLGHLVELVSL